LLQIFHTDLTSGQQSFKSPTEELQPCACTAVFRLQDSHVCRRSCQCGISSILYLSGRDKMLV